MSRGVSRDFSLQHVNIIITTTCVFSVRRLLLCLLPLCLPGDEAKRGIKEPAHLSQSSPLVNTDEEVRGRSCLEGHIHLLSKPIKHIQKYSQELNIRIYINYYEKERVEL